VTFVAVRVPGQVSSVLVDDNNRVHKGDFLAELDREPYEVAVAIRKAAVDTAKADLVAAKAMVRGIEARARSQRWKLQHAMEDVANQIALLHAKIAAQSYQLPAQRLSRDNIHQIRVSLRLPAEPDNGADLGLVPPDLDQTFSSVRQAQYAAELGIIHSINQTPKQMLEEFYKRDPNRDIDQIFAGLVPGRLPSSRPRRNSNPPNAILIRLN
jgi:membrane fusion protein, multidrug efflux system